MVFRNTGIDLFGGRLGYLAERKQVCFGTRRRINRPDNHLPYPLFSSDLHK